MSTQRQRTVIQIDVDDRGIRGLDRTLRRTFDDQMLAGFERVLERSKSTMDAMVKAAGRLGSAFASIRSGGSPGSSGTPQRDSSGRFIAGSGGGGGGGSSSADKSASFFSRVASTSMGTYLGGLGAAAGSPEGFFSQAAGGVPIFGGFMRGALNSVHKHADQYAASRESIAKQVGTLGRTNTPGHFQAYGMDQTQGFQQAAQFAQMAGRSGLGATENLNNTALQLQMLGGITEAPGIIRAAEAGGGSSGPSAMLQAVSAGLQMGIRESRLGQFISTATQVLEQTRLGGVDLSLQSVLMTMHGMKGLGAGFEGERGQQAGASAIQGLRNFNAGEDLASMLALRAAGFGNGTSYLDAMQKIQEHPEDLIPGILDGLSEHVGGSADARAEIMRTSIAPKLFGFTPSVVQARSMVAGDTDAFRGAVTEERGEQFLAERAATVGGAFRVPEAEARLRNRGINIGGDQVYTASRRVRNVEMDMTTAMAPHVAAGIHQIIDFVKHIYDVFREQGMAAAMAEVTAGAVDAAVEVASQAAETTVRAAAEALGADEEIQDRMMQDISNIPSDALNALRRGMGADTAEGRAAHRAISGMNIPPPPPPVLKESADAAGALRRAGELINQAAGYMESEGLPDESQVAVP